MAEEIAEGSHPLEFRDASTMVENIASEASRIRVRPQLGGMRTLLIKKRPISIAPAIIAASKYPPNLYPKRGPISKEARAPQKI
ncbi:MAG: hypothetical protein GY795_25425 [Desulfobacterales bacterium]|nr:hypothetical protein [Desulfobacterales bacterium]